MPFNPDLLGIRRPKRVGLTRSSRADDEIGMQHDDPESIPTLSYDACFFLNEVKSRIRHWHDVPLIGDGGTDATLARLRGLAGDLVRLVDSAQWSDWDVERAAYEASEEHDIDLLLSQPQVDEDELERLLDASLNKDGRDDGVTPIRDGDQYIGGARRG